MGTEKIQVDLVLDGRTVKKVFVDVENQAQTSGRKAGDEFESGFNTGVGSLAAGLRNQLIGLGAAFAGLAGISRIASDFGELEKAFAEIQTILPDVTQGNEELRQSFVDLSAQFGTSAAEQANSFYSIVSAGITDAAAAQEALTAANKLAIGGLTSTQTAIDILTSSINAYGAENLSAGRAADILFGTVRLGKTTVDELAGSLGLILPTAQSLGVGFEDVSAAVAALTTRGVSTSAAVTQLNAVLTAVLRNQQVAKSLGPEVAEAFSLQALQARGLTGFLSNLNNALGGSEQGLVKLLGSAEAARGVLTLAGDGFATLNTNVQQLENSAGAADRAFEIINSTTGAQLDQIGSRISAIFLNLANSSSGFIFSIASNINRALAFVLENFDAIANGFAVVVQKITAGFLALRFGPAIFNGLSRSLGGLIREFSILPTRIALARLRIAELGTSIRNLTFAGALQGLRNFTRGLSVARVGVRALRLSVNLLKTAATFGLALAFDFLLEKAIEIKDSFGGLGNTFQFVALTIQRSFNNIVLSAVRFIRQIEQLPLIGDRIKGSLGGTFDAIENNATSSLQSIEEQFDQLAQKVAEDTGIIPQFSTPSQAVPPTPTPQDLPTIDESIFEQNRMNVERALESTTSKTKEETSKQVNLAEVAYKRIANAFIANSFQIQASQEQLEATATESFQRIGAAATEGFARSFASIGEAIVKGENAFEAFGSAILGVLGDVAIQAGTLYTLLGIASFNPAQVAAGIALTILGGVLKALAGGGSSSPSVSAPGGGLTSNPIDGDTSPIDAPSQIGSQVSVNIQGDVFDSEGTGLRIADILKEQGFQNAVVS